MFFVGAKRGCFPSPGIAIPGAYDPDDIACPDDPNPPRLTLDDECEELEDEDDDRDDPELQYDDEDDDRYPRDE